MIGLVSFGTMMAAGSPFWLAVVVGVSVVGMLELHRVREKRSRK